MDMTLGKEYNFSRESKESVLGRRKSMRKTKTQIESMGHIEEWRIRNNMPAYLLIVPSSVLSTSQNQPLIFTKTLEDKKCRLREVK